MWITKSIFIRNKWDFNTWAWYENEWVGRCMGENCRHQNYVPWTSWHPKSWVTPLFVQQFVKPQSRKHQHFALLAFVRPNPSLTGSSPVKRIGDAENISIWRPHYGIQCSSSSVTKPKNPARMNDSPMRSGGYKTDLSSLLVKVWPTLSITRHKCWWKWYE